MKKEELIKNVEQQLHIPQDKPKNKKLFMFFGIPGSGKSTLAAEIGKRIPCVTISSDMIALSQKLDLSDHYHWTFEIFNLLVMKYLQLGYNVIADSNSDKYEIRKELYEIAEKSGAKVHCFWIKTDVQVVLDRQRERKEKEDKLRERHIFYVDPKEIREKYVEELEGPVEGENVIVLDGAQSFSKQLTGLEKELFDR